MTESREKATNQKLIGNIRQTYFLTSSFVEHFKNQHVSANTSLRLGKHDYVFATRKAALVFCLTVVLVSATPY